MPGIRRLTAERHCDGPVAAAAAGIAAKHDSVIASQAKQSMDAAGKEWIASRSLPSDAALRVDASFCPSS
jgi:hypothetical protein